MNTPIIEVRNLSKTFVLHQQGGVAIEALSGISFSVDAGECVALHGPSGAGKSTLLRALYGNYLPTGGSIRVRCGGEDVDITSADPRTVIRLRRGCISYVSQFLRVIPRVSTLDLVAEPLLEAGEGQAAARSRAEGLLARLNLPDRARLHPPVPHSPARRAHGLAGRREPAGGHRSDPRSARERGRHRGHFPRRRGPRSRGRPHHPRQAPVTFFIKSIQP